MTSPFPGMDPYLERHWGDVHHRFVTYACDQIQQRLPPGLRARMEERVFVEAESNGRPVYPDIRVVEYARRQKGKPVSTGRLAVAEPLVISLPDDPVTEGFIKIIDIGSGDRIVTVIELLSPTNKVPGKGQELYQSKQEECQVGRVHLVEIDLVRTGRRALMVPQELIPESHRTTYQVCVYRAWDHSLGEIYPVPLRKRLPVIKVPLRRKDADVPLDIQSVINQCYRKGAYGTLDYEREPDPPFDPEDARWADALLREKGLRKGKPQSRGGRNGKRRRGD
jgi:hypothetical protein